MRQLLQHLGNGATMLVDVPAPGPQPGAVLVRTTRSLISAGTERMLVDFGRAGWIGKARQQPEKVRAVLDKIRANGILETVRAVRSKLSQPIPLGYCQVGVVLDGGARVGETQGGKFLAGDRVVSNGPHAEVVSVSQHLCAKIPDAVSDEAATFTPLAAIALEGLHLLAPERGDKVVVAGLGLIGQLAVRLLRAKGCEVLGLDPSPERRALAEKHGAVIASGDPVQAALAWTGGVGAAGVLITASTATNDVVNQAARSCRRRGRVVLVGVVGLQLNRTDFYRNEVSFQVSCSYGTRDGKGEQCAQRNFEQVLSWMNSGALAVEDLITHRFPFSESPAAYAALAERSGLGILLSYENASAQQSSRTVRLRDAPAAPAPIGLTLVGAGNFALRTWLPALAKSKVRANIVSVVSRFGASARLVGQTAGALQATTDFAAALEDASATGVVIATRHDSHAAQTISALRAHKHVWVEKPLGLSLDELASIEAALASAVQEKDSRPPILMVGFNRRFAPAAVALREALQQRRGQWRFTCTVNAGQLDPEHWSLDPRVGGGRIVGEGCHFIDLLRYLAGAPIEQVRCVRRDRDGQDGGAFELAFVGGSSALLDYRTDLPPHAPKEFLQVTAGAAVSAEIHNWTRLTSRGLDGLSWGAPWSRAPRKGHREAIEAFLKAIETGAPPIPVEEILEVSRFAIEMQSMTRPS